MIDKYFDVDTELQPVRDAISILVDELANKMYKANKIKGIVTIKRLQACEDSWLIFVRLGCRSHLRQFKIKVLFLIRRKIKKGSAFFFFLLRLKKMAL